MKATELIKCLENYVAKHGDHEVIIHSDYDESCGDYSVDDYDEEEEHFEIYI